MDPHSEVEVKFDADGVDLNTYKNFVEVRCRFQGARVVGYKAVQGTDTYFVINGKPLRYRRGGDRCAELTYKERKSADSISDRVEINLPLKSGTPPAAVEAMLTYLGAEVDFSIEKWSYIFHLDGIMNGIDYRATLALYDVHDVAPGLETTRRFLEVEIEAASNCTPAQGLEVLDSWRALVEDELQVQGPLNQSLYEIYTKRKST